MAVRDFPQFAGKLGIVVTVPDAAEAAAFYGRAFGAEEVARWIVPHHPPSVGPVKGITMRIGEAVINLSTVNPRTTSTVHKWGSKTAETLGGFSVALTLYVDDAEKAAARAVAAGARLRGAIEDTPSGDRVAVVEDPFAQPWILAAAHEEITVEENNRRWQQLCGPAAPRLELPARPSMR